MATWIYTAYLFALLGAASARRAVLQSGAGGQSFQVEKCGLPGGPCGATGPSQNITCPSDKQTCPSGYYCAGSLDSSVAGSEFSICLADPPNCGVLGNKCCPPEVRQPPNLNDYGEGQPFCYDANVVCGAWSGSVNGSECKPLLKSPDECGGVGRPPCDGFYRQSTDKPVPSICVDGAYDKYDSATNTSACALNEPDCGLEGKLCCTRSTPCCTVQGCKKTGLYCPFGENVEPVCQKCPQPPPENLTWECTHPLFLDAPITGPVNYTE